TGLHESVVRETIPAGRSDRRDTSVPATRPGRGVKRPADEIVGCLLCDVALVPTLRAEDWDLIAAYASPLVVQVASEMRRRSGTPGQMVLASLSDALSPDASEACIALARRVEAESDAARLERYLEDCLTRLRLDAAPASDSPGAEGRQVEIKNLDDRLEAIRARRSSLGADRRVLPRASDAPGGSSEPR
ncbi:MAG: hypothetical protein KDA28_07355, partial [Phycisphaerales bacterium]|nr:hypothetical protein [Phycisphaerales bacterium]